MSKILKRLLVVGASVRPVVQAANTLGIEIIATDLFADQDTRAAAVQVLRLQNYADVLNHIGEFSVDAWLYTGGLENEPRLVEELSKLLPLLGVSAKNLPATKNPYLVAESLENSGVYYPETVPHFPATDERRWLRKQVSTVAGQGVTWADRGEPTLSRTVEETPSIKCGETYYQEWKAGESASLAFIGFGESAALLCGFEQQVGRPGFPFGYVGSVSPLPLNEAQRKIAATIGNYFAAAFKLKGLFGVDIIVSADGLIPIEINPRVTAAMELLLDGLAVLLAKHIAEFGWAVPGADLATAREADFRAKRVAFAASTKIISNDDLTNWQQHAAAANVQLADIPNVATKISVGEPILTVLVRRNQREAAITAARSFVGLVEGEKSLRQSLIDT